jgi:hypothetical protein
MTVPIDEFVEQLINEAISSRRARGRKQPLVSMRCEVVVDNAIMPSCSLREKTRGSSNPTEDQPVRYPTSRSSTGSSSSSSSSSSRTRSPRYHCNEGRTMSFDDQRDSLSSPRIIASHWKEYYSSLDCFVDRSPQSVLLTPTGGNANMFPPISPRSARWTSSSTPPRTLLKSKGGIKRLDSDSPLTCPQRMLMSPGGETLPS